MCRNALVSVLGVVGVLLASPLAMAQDVMYSERREFTLTDTRAFTERAEVSVRYITARSAGLDAFAVGEQYFGPVRNLEASLNGDQLRDDAIRSYTPEREDIFLNSGRVHRIGLPETPTPGSTFEYSYERTYLSPAYAPILWIPNVNRLEGYDIVVNHPPGVTVTFDVFAPRGDVDHRITATSQQAKLSFRNLVPLDDLPLFAHNGAHAFVLLDIRDGDKAYTPTEPDEFASWYANLVNVRAPPPTILPLAEGLQGESDSATVAAFHDYVRETIRYIADERDAGAFIPRAPDLVVERQYGDCKDRAFLVSAMAQSLGIRVDPVLISTVPEPEFERVHLGLFNHVICAFTHDDGSRTYFDPTDPYSSFGDLPESDVDGHALRLGQGEAERLFVQAQSEDPTLDIEMDLDLDAPEASAAEVTIRGSLLGMVRAIEARSTEMEARNALSGVAGSLLYKIRLSRIHPVEEGPRHRTYRARADLSQFVIASPTKRYLPLTPFRAVESDASDRRDDSLPIFTGDRPNVRLGLNVDGGAWRADSTAHAFGDPEGPVWFSAEAVSSDEASRVTYHFGQRTRRFLGADRETYMNLADAYLGARRDVVIFRSPSDE